MVTFVSISRVVLESLILSLSLKGGACYVRMEGGLLSPPPPPPR